MFYFLSFFLQKKILDKLNQFQCLCKTFLIIFKFYQYFKKTKKILQAMESDITTEKVFQRLCQVPENKVCFECGKNKKAYSQNNN